MFERRSHPLLSPRAFRRRMLRMAGLALALVALSLTLGASGYHALEGLSWLEATLNAAMILTGMGPVDPVRTTQGKLFAIAYALFSGVVFLSSVALILAPIGHRLLHHFHLEEDGDAQGGPQE
jgi:Na+/melibiose symporter-like transporter